MVILMSICFKDKWQIIQELSLCNWSICSERNSTSKHMTSLSDLTQVILLQSHKSQYLGSAPDKRGNRDNYEISHISP